MKNITHLTRIDDTWLGQWFLQSCRWILLITTAISSTDRSGSVLQLGRFWIHPAALLGWEIEISITQATSVGMYYEQVSEDDGGRRQKACMHALTGNTRAGYHSTHVAESEPYDKMLRPLTILAQSCMETSWHATHRRHTNSLQSISDY